MGRRGGNGNCGSALGIRRHVGGNGGFNPAANVPLTTDTVSRAVVGVEVTKAGCDSVG